MAVPENESIQERLGLRVVQDESDGSPDNEKHGVPNAVLFTGLMIGLFTVPLAVALVAELVGTLFGERPFDWDNVWWVYNYFVDSVA